MANEIDNTMYELHIKPQFDEVNRKLDRLDVSINGNGKPGLKMETDRNTRWIRSMAKFLWVIASAVIGIIVWIVRGHFA